MILNLPFALEHVEEAAAEAVEKFNSGELVIEHVSNSSVAHPLIHLPTIFGINLSVTKHVFMLWLVAAIVLVVVTWVVRRYIKQEHPVPSGMMNAVEAFVEYIRESVVRPNVGDKWVNTWTPLILTIFFFILVANGIGLIPLFDFVAVIDRFFLHSPEGSFIAGVVHGGTTATGNFNVTAALAVITFFAIIIAGSKAHGFIKYWKNIVPHGLNPFIYVLLIPIEIISMFVKPFALTMRLAANMTGGHIAILAILSFVFLFAEMTGRALIGISVGIGSVLLATGISALEIVIVLVQAYVFALLSAVFIGMAINVHH
ncbi:MAG: synthase subcomplex subunit [Acidobacteria bacterium]|nr:synthase subcomplex subunit [Acidobacteriota bacterium]